MHVFILHERGLGGWTLSCLLCLLAGEVETEKGGGRQKPKKKQVKQIVGVWLGGWTVMQSSAPKRYFLKC